MGRHKIAVFVPVDAAAAVREAIGRSGGGRLGNYSFCSFSTRGIGRFRPENGAKPAIGQVGALEEVAEERIEVTCDREVVQRVLAAIRAVHPYEEVPIDVWALQDGI